MNKYKEIYGIDISKDVFDVYGSKSEIKLLLDNTNNIKHKDIFTDVNSINFFIFIHNNLKFGKNIATDVSTT